MSAVVGHQDTAVGAGGVVRRTLRGYQVGVHGGAHCTYYADICLATNMVHLYTASPAGIPVQVGTVVAPTWWWWANILAECAEGPTATDPEGTPAGGTYAPTPHADDALFWWATHLMYAHPPTVKPPWFATLPGAGPRGAGGAVVYAARAPHPIAGPDGPLESTAGWQAYLWCGTVTPALRAAGWTEGRMWVAAREALGVL